MLHEKSELEQGLYLKDRLRGEEVQQRLAKWESKFQATSGSWRIVQADSIKSAGGATAVKLEDGSILFGGPRPETDIYEISAKVTMPRITAVRLEVLIDTSLSHNGPGRQDNGNLHLSEFKLLATGEDGNAKTIALHKPMADFSQNGWTIEHACCNFSLDLLRTVTVLTSAMRAQPRSWRRSAWFSTVAVLELAEPAMVKSVWN